jgi:hypothetical protein
VILRFSAYGGIVSRIDGRSRLLSACHGYAVYANDGLAGEVETPLFPPDAAVPDFLVLRITCRGRLFPRFVSLPVRLVLDADADGRQLRVAVDRATLERMPDNVPVAAASSLTREHPTRPPASPRPAFGR